MIFGFGEDCAEAYIEYSSVEGFEFHADLDECPESFYQELIEIDTAFAPDLEHRFDNWQEFTNV